MNPSLRHSIFLLGMVLGILGYVVWGLFNRSAYVAMHSQVALFVDESSQALVIGDPHHWFVAERLGQRGLFSSAPVHYWVDLEPGFYQWGDLSVVKIEDQLGSVDINGTRWMIIDQKEPIDSSPFSHNIDLNASFWMLFANDYPHALTPPQKGIFLLNDRLRKPTMIDLARDKQIPFIWSKEYGTIMVRSKDGHWDIQTER